MKKQSRLHKASELLSSLNTKILKTKRTEIQNEIDSRIGTLSNTSKMPCKSWSIPTHYCITGSKLAKVEGTPCSMCYAQKGAYNWSPTQNAMERRLQGFKEDSDWVKLMAIRLLLRKDEYFRWFDSGDLQSLDMAEKICQVADLTAGYVDHWLPTQERAIIDHLVRIPMNLTIRISSTKIGKMQNVPIGTVGTYIIREEKDLEPGSVLCSSDAQGHKCLDCRNCWDPSIKQVDKIIAGKGATER